MAHDPTMEHVKFDNDTGDSNITVLIGGKLFSCRDDHPSWDDIVAGAEAKDPDIEALFKPGDTISKKFAELTDRISVHNGEILWDGDPVHNTLTQKILDLMDERVEDWRVFVAFMEKLYTNPQRESQEQAFDFLMSHHFTVTADGNFLAYKGVDYANGQYLSRQSGTAIVNDNEITGQIPNPVGAVVRMPRAQVKHDPYTACHDGLHVATFGFARSFAGADMDGKVLEVEINPRDIVSVPYFGDKLRVCRYKVLGIVDAPSTASYQKAVETPEVDVPTVLVQPDGEVEYDADAIDFAGDDLVDEPDDIRYRVLDDLEPTPENVISDGTHPTAAEFENMQGRAKRRRRNFQKYALKQGWTFLGSDPSNREHWVTNS